MMIGNTYPEKILPPNNGKEVFENVSSILQSSDLSIGNLEGVIMDSAGESKHCKNSSSCHVFKTPFNYMQNFKDAGFDILSIANNHSNDFGDKGLNNTIEALKKYHIGYAGLFSCKTYIITHNNLKIGYTAFAFSSKTLKVTDIKIAKEIVSNLAKQVDIVIVNMHIGAEGSKYTHVTKKEEYFLGEDRGNPYLFAHSMIDVGADIIIGNGPHVLRALELYHNRIIAYSLGNFTTTTGINITGKSGYSTILNICVNSKGEFLHGHIYSFLQKGNNGNRKPTADLENHSLNEIKKLTNEDFPSTSLVFTNSSDILKINKHFN
jgi:poly-gamma-glutamate capsule biosynthesis protein CapA/YwtB (metallophosphatase superfamily)